MQQILPHHLLSRLVGWFGRSRVGFIKNTMIRWFIKQYNVDLCEAEQSNPKQFSSFNAFFTRALKPGCRPISEIHNAIVCPVDGSISELGYLHEQQLLQAKGVEYDVLNLLGQDRASAAHFHNGAFLTAYLSPKDYHRVHMPIAGRLLKMTYVPGRIFSVNLASVAGIPNLFARNERVICHFDTALGQMAVVLVGAMIVASIHTVWHGAVTPTKRRIIQHWNYTDQTIQLARGVELGHFQMGSTVILLFEPKKIQWLDNLSANQSICMGEAIAQIIEGH